MKKKFEYKIIIGEHQPEKDEFILNDLGKEGWELVAISTTRIVQHEFFGKVRTCYWLKKEIEEIIEEIKGKPDSEKARQAWLERERKRKEINDSLE